MVENVKIFENFWLFGYTGVTLRLFSNIKLQLNFKKSTLSRVRLLLNVLTLLKYETYEISNKYHFSEKNLEFRLIRVILT